MPTNRVDTERQFNLGPMTYEGRTMGLLDDVVALMKESASTLTDEAWETLFADRGLLSQEGLDEAVKVLRTRYHY